MEIRSAFTTDNDQQQFQQHGYVMVKNFLSRSEIQNLRDFYFENLTSPMKGFHASMHSTNFDFIRKVHGKNSEVFFPKVEMKLNHYRPVVGNYTVKEPGPESFFDFHLDWSMLDETKARSVTIWVPLENTHAINGNLWILDQSVQMGNTYRCSPGLQLLAADASEFKNKKFEKKILEMTAGDAIIYDHKLFHGSPPNHTQEPRLAINLAMLPEEINALHYFHENHQIKVYEVDDDFFCTCLTHSPMNMDKYVCIENFEIKNAPILQQEVNQMILEKADV